MSNLPEERNYIQEEETRPKASTSTSVLSRVGSDINFIISRMHQEKLWAANGPYNAFPGAQTGIDGGIVLPIDMEIWALSMTSGINSFLLYRFDLALAVQNPAGCQQPVLITQNLNMGDMITCDFTNKQPSGESASITLHLRPR
jgi:hypothetical protein